MIRRIFCFFAPNDDAYVLHMTGKAGASTNSGCQQFYATGTFESDEARAVRRRLPVVSHGCYIEDFRRYSLLLPGRCSQ